MHLYEITKEMKTLDNLFIEAIDEETGEIKDAGILDKFEEEIAELLKGKAGNIIKFLKMQEMNLENIDAEIKRLTALKKSYKNKIDNLKTYTVSNLERIDKKKIETEVGILSLRRSESVNIKDVELLDKRFRREKITVEADKTAIKKAIKEGEEVAGAELVLKNSLQIR